MKLGEGMFTIKLYELEQQYGRMQSRLRLCQQEDHPKIRQELQKAMDEYKEGEFLLQKNVESSRSPAVAALARAQLEYVRTVRKILEQDLPDYHTASPALHRRTRTKQPLSMRNMPLILPSSPRVMR